VRIPARDRRLAARPRAAATGPAPAVGVGRGGARRAPSDRDRLMTAVRAVAVGYQGFGNLGDEAILAGIEELLGGTGIVVSHVVSGPGPVSAFPAARRVPTRRMRPTLQALRALRRAQLLLISGGGLLNDHWATVVPTYLAWVVLGRLLGLRVAWLGVGVGPLRRRWSRLLA